MKFLLPFSFLALSFVMVAPAEASHSRPTYVRSHQDARVYCTEDRFQSYIALASSMRDFVTPYEYAELYIPLRVKASKALVTLRNYGPLSHTTHTALHEIVRFVNANERNFDVLWEIEAFFPVAQDLMDMTQSLSRDLQ